MRPIAYHIEMGHDRLVWECQTDQRFDRPKSFREGIDRGGIVAFVIKFAPGVNLGR